MRECNKTWNKLVNHPSCWKYTSLNTDEWILDEKLVKKFSYVGKLITPALNSSNINLLKQFEHVNSLYLYDDEGVSHLLQTSQIFPKLTSLFSKPWNKNTISTDNFNYNFAFSSSLTDLTLVNRTFTSLENLPQTFPALKRLELKYFELLDHDFSYLSKLEHLTSLKLNYFYIEGILESEYLDKIIEEESSSLYPIFSKIEELQLGGIYVYHLPKFILYQNKKMIHNLHRLVLNISFQKEEKMEWWNSFLFSHNSSEEKYSIYIQELTIILSWSSQHTDKREVILHSSFFNFFKGIKKLTYVITSGLKQVLPPSTLINNNKNTLFELDLKGDFELNPLLKECKSLSRLVINDIVLCEEEKFLVL